MQSAAPVTSRPVKLFRNGRNQSVRIPRDFELPGTDATIRREGMRLIIEPAERPSPAEVMAYLRTLPPDNDEWPDISDANLPPLDDIVL